MSVDSSTIPSGRVLIYKDPESIYEICYLDPSKSGAQTYKIPVSILVSYKDHSISLNDKFVVDRLMGTTLYIRRPTGYELFQYRRDYGT